MENLIIPVLRGSAAEPAAQPAAHRIVETFADANPIDDPIGDDGWGIASAVNLLTVCNIKTVDNKKSGRAVCRAASFGAGRAKA